MPFWTYMLHCRGGYYYTGHTDHLETRVAAHEAGMIEGFTKDHLPVSLVWADEFPTRDEALAMERRIKGWSRAKKMALIRGDWDELSRLARKKDNPSTSSGRTGGGWCSLRSHPESSVSGVEKIQATAGRPKADLIALDFELHGRLSDIVLPRVCRSARADELWRTTCFEAFVGWKSESYLELNLSPSTCWAAYRFDSYRSGMHNALIDGPSRVEVTQSDSRLRLKALVKLPGVSSGRWKVALSAVIEETDGTKSYWALAHPPGKPDFHHPDCFTLELPPPNAA